MTGEWVSKICPKCGAENSICVWECWNCGYSGFEEAEV